MNRSARSLPWQSFFLVVVVVASGGLFGFWALRDGGGAEGPAETQSAFTLEQIPFDGAKAYEYLKQICALGPRPSGSPGMAAQQRMLVEHFQRRGARVELQRFQFPHPLEGRMMAMANLVVTWHPDRKERILLCTHYDTLPYPLMDRQNPKGVFIGANDGGSGTALLMALGERMATLETAYGVDFVLFDAEEFLFHPQGRYFLGSEFFSRQYVENPPAHRYRQGVLLDMVGDADLQIYQERNSLSWPRTRALVEEIWKVAGALGVKEFVPRKKYEISDDHLALNNIAGIPTCDIIDFDYPPWHTQADTPDKCSSLSLAKVGWVIQEWLRGKR